MPPDHVKKMSDRYKEICGCITCLKMKMFQELLNKIRRTILDQQLKRAHDRSKLGGLAIATQVKIYDTEMNLKKTVREAVTRFIAILQ